MYTTFVPIANKRVKETAEEQTKVKVMANILEIVTKV